MAPALDQPARPAGAARPLVERCRAQQPGREVERQGRLADPVGAGEQDGLGHWPADHRGRRAERDRLPPGPGSIHDGVGQTITRRSWRAPRLARGAPLRCSVAVVTAALAAAVDALLAAGLRVARGLAGALVRRASVDVSRAGKTGIVRSIRPLCRLRPKRSLEGLRVARGWLPAWPRTSTSCGWHAAWPKPWPSVHRSRRAPPRHHLHGVRVRLTARDAEAGRPGLLGDLGSKHRLELGRHVAPRLVRAATGRCRRRPVAAAAVAAIVTRWLRRRARPAAHVGVAVDPPPPPEPRRSARDPSPTGRPTDRHEPATGTDPEHRHGSRRAAARR